MGTVERHVDRGTWRAETSLRTLAAELRTVRIGRGLSQQDVALAARVSRPAYSRIERSVDPHLTIRDASRIAAVLGLNLSVRAYPAGPAIRDAAQARALAALLSNVGAPLRHRVEVPLPRNEDRPEYRAWDAVIWGHGKRTAIEFETRLYDLQAQMRTIRLKVRDDPPDQFVLAVSNTRANRRVVADYPELFSDLPRQRTASALRGLRAGHHPPTGLILL